jgi:hypothetical protein
MIIYARKLLATAGLSMACSNAVDQLANESYGGCSW